ncbi:hypothetical protein P4O66_017575, partial [Electrophorus voltai]
MTDKKAVVKKDAVECATQAMGKSNVEKDIGVHQKGNIPVLEACDVEQLGCKAVKLFMSVALTPAHTALGRLLRVDPAETLADRPAPGLFSPPISAGGVAQGAVVADGNEDISQAQRCASLLIRTQFNSPQFHFCFPADHKQPSTTALNNVSPALVGDQGIAAMGGGNVRRESGTAPGMCSRKERIQEDIEEKTAGSEGQSRKFPPAGCSVRRIGGGEGRSDVTEDTKDHGAGERGWGVDGCCGAETWSVSAGAQR